jgi:3-oxoacyl-[acyl-carrier protein] reductase
MLLSEARIIITGAASGFGKSMALHFARNNALVYALDINEDSLNRLKAEHPQIYIYTCDVSSNTSVENIIDNIFDNDNCVNVLVNNAGIMRNSPLINLLKRPDNRHSLDLWQKIIEINQNSVFYTTRSFASKMIKYRNKGVIVNVSSISANGNIGQTAYSASKAAVEAMTKVWAKELGFFGIRSVAIAPGFIDTVGTRGALDEKMLNSWISKTPLKRAGNINEVVSATQFAIENDFLTGEVIKINGGLVI